MKNILLILNSGYISLFCMLLVEYLSLVTDFSDALRLL